MNKQPLISYVNAGYNAFRSAFSRAHYGLDADNKPGFLHEVEPTENPYSQKPYSKLWRKGWNEAKREFESRNPAFSNFRSEPFKDNRRVLEFVQQLERRENYKARKADKATQTGRVSSNRPNKSNGPKDHGKSVNLKTIARFNKKHRTVA